MDRFAEIRLGIVTSDVQRPFTDEGEFVGPIDLSERKPIPPNTVMIGKVWSIPQDSLMFDGHTWMD